MLFWCSTTPLTWGCQQVAARLWKMMGRTTSLGELALDLPHQLLALAEVDLLRLGEDQLVDLRVAVLGIVALGLAGVVLDQVDVGIVDGDARSG